MNKEADVEYKAQIQGKTKMGVGNSQGGRFNKKSFPFKNNDEGSQGKPYCPKCKRHHNGTCNFPTGACSGCGETGCMIAKYPKIYLGAQGAQGGAVACPPISATLTQARVRDLATEDKTRSLRIKLGFLP